MTRHHLDTGARLHYLACMDDITRHIKRLQKYMTEGRGRKVRLAGMAGIVPSTLTHALDPDWNPTAETLSALVRSLDKIEADEARARPLPSSIVAVA